MKRSTKKWWWYNKNAEADFKVIKDESKIKRLLTLYYGVGAYFDPNFVNNRGLKCCVIIWCRYTDETATIRTVRVCIEMKGLSGRRKCHKKQEVKKP